MGVCVIVCFRCSHRKAIQGLTLSKEKTFSEMFLDILKNVLFVKGHEQKAEMTSNIHQPFSAALG